MKKLSKEERFAYAYAYLSYLFRGEKPKIRRIFLFGSIARGDFDEKSDLDLFLDVDKKDEKRLTKMAERALNRFQEVEGEKWRLKGIQNKISIKVGFLEDWKLKESVEKEGIILYSTAASSNLQKFLLFNLEPITPIKKRIKVVRKLFGRKETGYKDSGLVAEYKGKILNPRSFIVSYEGLGKITAFLSKEKVRFSFEEIWR